jgi:hypothetical protein
MRSRASAGRMLTGSPSRDLEPDLDGRLHGQLGGAEVLGRRLGLR